MPDSRQREVPSAERPRLREGSAAGRLKFESDTGFHSEIKRRVSDYFRQTGLDPRDSARMYVKTAAILVWLGVSYALLVFVATTWWLGLLLSVSLALAIAGVGFCIQHDASHGAY